MNGESPRAHQITVRGAREHNLKNVDVVIPRDKLVVITGLSGSGKSSLAFDTIYAEGQRRYVESLSAYARQFLGQMEKPDVDQIDGLSPAISIDQKGAGRSPRSTVGTVTEIYDYLRLMYARIGQAHCPKCGRLVSSQTTGQIADQLMAKEPGTQIAILSPVVQQRKGEHRDVLDRARRDGFVRVRVDGRMRDLTETILLERNHNHDIEIIIDRLVVGEDIASRLSDSIEQASSRSEGIVLVLVGGDRNLEGASEELFSGSLACVYCGISMEAPEPRNFSFNNPHGACPECTGLGSKLEVDADAVVPNPSLSLEDGAVAAWFRGPSYGWLMDTLDAACTRYKVPMDRPWDSLSSRQKKFVLFGLPAHETVPMRYRTHTGRIKHLDVHFEGVVGTLEKRYRTTDSESVRADIERVMRLRPCSKCNGTRLKAEYAAVTVQGIGIAQLTAHSVDQLIHLVSGWTLTEREQTIARRIIKEIRERLGFLSDVGLDYLTLDRSAQTLSGGEAQRIRLATQIGSRLTGVLYVLDEPSIGLHQRDNHKLIRTLVSLRDLGNSVLVVEHDEDTIRAADYVIDVGPGAGEAGGHIVAAGTVEEILDAKDSITAQYLRGERSVPLPRVRRAGTGEMLTVHGATANNLKGIDVSFPLGSFICVAGVSGSGKSTLVNDILYRKLAMTIHRARELPAAHRAVSGIEHIDKVVDVDQSPIGRTPRSNPATYVGVFTDIRTLFSKLPEARMRGYKPGRFSFNVRGGRCEACEGDGTIKIEMHFLPDVYVPCDVCRGRRYNDEALAVKFKGHSIADVLAMPVDDAVELFANQPPIHRRLRTLQEVGLGYIRLGQPATQLSGGEAQRVKLSTELSRIATGRTLYILDEPTTGLHFADVERLLGVLHALVDKGNTVLVIEHNLDVIKTADHVIDLGPGGGDAGGYLVASGTPEELAANRESPTGEFLGPLLGRQRAARRVKAPVGVATSVP